MNNSLLVLPLIPPADCWCGAAVGALLFAVGLVTSHQREQFVQWVAVNLTRLVYRTRVIGLENVPREGPALLIFNHTSYADGNVVLSCLRRVVRFVVWRTAYEQPILHALGSTMQVIPIDASMSTKEIVRALRKASEALQKGELVCIFAEGSMSRIGIMLPFQRGFEVVMKRAPGVPIIPGFIDNTWVSLFSFRRGKFFWKRPERVFEPVTVMFGAPMPSTATAQEVRERVQILGAECGKRRRSFSRSLASQFLRIAHRFARRPCLADATTPSMTFGQVLIRGAVLSRLLKRTLGPEKYVGVFLPSSAGGALTNIALTLLGKVPVNLNYTVSKDVTDICVEQAGIKQILTSKLFLEKIKVEPAGELIRLEELRSEVKLTDKLYGLLARLLPAWLAERTLFCEAARDPDALATLIFSSGSTGIPKGVMLSHHNITSNIDAMVQLVDAGPDDVVVGVLPFFHSFGYTVTLWLPFMIGCKVAYHTNPLEAEVVGRIAREHKVTVFLSTATFLRNYIRKCKADDFKTARLVLTGAEKLPMQVADQFEKKFGVRPLEGYGCTELSPTVSANRPDFVLNGVRQVGEKRGTIGHPLPNMAVRIVDPDTWEPLPIGTPGLLIVTGPNVMQGYLNKPEMTAEVVRDGWYATGDIAALDEDGFLTITDRLSRFSKLGGEMVPHAKIEDTIHEIVETTDRLCAVVGVPDERKGERLVVLHTSLPISVDALWKKLKERVPPLWLPAKSAFYQLDELPLLGSGKLDLKAVKTIANEKAGA